MRHQTATALDGEDQLISQAIATVARRLFADFQPAVSMAEVLMTILQCRRDLDTVPDGALPELVERCARERLANLRTTHDHERH